MPFQLTVKIGMQRLLTQVNKVSLVPISITIFYHCNLMAQICALQRIMAVAWPGQRTARWPVCLVLLYCE